MIDDILTKASGNRETYLLFSSTAPCNRIAQTATTFSCDERFENATTPVTISGDLRCLRVMCYTTYSAAPSRELARAAPLPSRHLRSVFVEIGRCLCSSTIENSLDLLSVSSNASTFCARHTWRARDHNMDTLVRLTHRAAYNHTVVRVPALRL